MTLEEIERRLAQAPANGGVRLTPDDAETLLKALSASPETKHVAEPAHTKRRVNRRTARQT